MSFTKIVPQLWMLLPRDEREQIAKDFNLSKTGVAEIRDQDVISDGYCQADLDAITHEKMTEYVGSEETFPRAWEITAAKARSILHPPTAVIGTQELNNLKEVSNEEFAAINTPPRPVSEELPNESNQPKKVESKKLKKGN